MSSDLHKGSSGAEVGNLQRFLVDLGYRDATDMPLVVDESFGAKTEHALTSFQKAFVLPASGIFEVLTRRRAIPLGFLPFVQARSCSILWPGKRKVRQIVIHTMECLETNPLAAENVASWFAGPSAPKASAHYMIDNDSTVQCVRDTDEAWHASQGNAVGLGIEHAGFARQTADDWSDQASSAILLRSARLAARLCRTHAIPILHLSHEEIRAGAPGFCGHVDVNAAYGNLGSHTDPGFWFPWASYLALVEENL